jgi:hypothetical protein
MCGDTLRQTSIFACSGICGSHSAFRSSGAPNIDALFLCLGGTDTVPIKSVSGQLRQICVFASGGICRSRSAFWYVKCRRTIFQAGWDRCGFHKKRIWTRYAELVFLHLLGYVGHVVHSDVFMCKKSTHYFSCSGGTGTNSTKSVSEHVTPNLCFCIWWDLWIT